jgi:hypothetical protein
MMAAHAAQRGVTGGERPNERAETTLERRRRPIETKVADDTHPEAS